MSSYERRIVLLTGGALVCGLVSGCFRPMLSEAASARELRGQIALPAIDTRFDHALHQSLEARLGTPSDPRLRLDVLTRITEDDLAITQDDTITRKSLTARADYTVVSILDGRDVVLGGSVTSQSGYNSTASLYATRAVRRDTEERLARDLGERIARRILADADRLIEL